MKHEREPGECAGVVDELFEIDGQNAGTGGVFDGRGEHGASSRTTAPGATPDGFRRAAERFMIGIEGGVENRQISGPTLAKARIARCLIPLPVLSGFYRLMHGAVSAANLVPGPASSRAACLKQAMPPSIMYRDALLPVLRQMDNPQREGTGAYLRYEAVRSAFLDELASVLEAGDEDSVEALMNRSAARCQARANHGRGLGPADARMLCGGPERTGFPGRRRNRGKIRAGSGKPAAAVLNRRDRRASGCTCRSFLPRPCR
jgi:hypothetical protein